MQQLGQSVSLPVVCQHTNQSASHLVSQPLLLSLNLTFVVVPLIPRVGPDPTELPVHLHRRPHQHLRRTQVGRGGGEGRWVSVRALVSEERLHSLFCHLV